MTVFLRKYDKVFKNMLMTSSKRRTQLKWYTYILVFCMTEAFACYGHTPIRVYSVTFFAFFAFVISILFEVILILESRGKISINRTYYITVPMFCLVVAEMFNTSHIAPNQSFVLTLTEAYPYLLVCAAIHVLDVLVCNQKGLNWFLDTIEKGCATMSAIACVAYVLYPKVKLFIPATELTRNGLPRLFYGGAIITSMGCLISLSKIRDHRHSTKLSYFNIVFALVKIGLIEQGRSALLYLLFTIIYCMFDTKRSHKIARVLFRVAIVVGIVLSVFGDLFSTTIASWSSSDFGILARMNGLQFFIEKFYEYPILGMGFITSSQSQDSISYALLNSANGYHFSRNDVGLIGLLNMMGIIGVSWYILVVANMWKKARKIMNDFNDNLPLLLVVYTMITSVNLIATDLQRILWIPITLTIVTKWNIEDKSN